MINNVFYAQNDKIYPLYVSKQNSDCQKHIVLLMIPNGECSYHIAVKESPALLRVITWKNNGDPYCLNCLHLLRIKKTNANLIKKYV